MLKRLLFGRRTTPPASFLRSCLLLALLLIGGFGLPAVAQPISGTKVIPGDYASLTAAFADLTAKGVSGPVVMELQPGYAPTSAETAGGISYGFAGGSTTNTVTVRPAGAATNLSIGGTVMGPMFSITGGKNLIVDGRPGGSGAAVSGAASATDLTISNSSTDASSAAVSFINDASGNVLQHCQLRASTSGVTTGAVVYFGASSAGGNSSNTVQYNDIREAGSSFPTVGVLCTGSKNAGNAITGNNVYNFFSTTTTTYGLYLSAVADSWNITGNSFYQTTSRTATSGVVLYGINVSAGSNHTIAGNFIGGLAPGCGAAGSPLTLSSSTANRFVGIHLSTNSTVAASSIQGNTVANIAWTTSSTATGTGGVFSGIYVAAGNANIGTVTGNNIGTLALPISVTPSASGAVINGISTNSSSTVGTINVAQNTVTNLTGTGKTASIGPVVKGIFLASATSATVSRNRVFNLASTIGTASLCYGLDAQATAATLANNLIADLRAPAATGTNALVGISLAGTGTVSAYYNTVHLANGAGAAGSSALYASTAVTLTLRNNILVNNSAATATSLAVAYRRSAAGLTSYASASDNNLLYGGSLASPTHLLFSDGAAAIQILADYKAFVGPARDQYSVTELPPFQNTTASNVAMQATLLHLAAGTPTQVEKGGLPIADFPNDFDNDLRDASFPDLGADEGSFALLDKNYPYFRYALLGSGPVAASRTFANVVIADPSGLAPISATAGPLLYYRKGSTDNFASVPATAVSGTSNTLTYTFTFNYSLLSGGGVAAGDRIEYYLAAQDNAPTPNGGTSPVNNAAPIANTGPPGSALASAYTSAPNSFVVVAAIPAVLYVGTDPGGGATFYPSLTKAGGLFEALNNNYVTQNVTAIINASILDEDGANALNALTTDGSGTTNGSYALTIQSDGPLRTISGAGLATAAAPGLIRFSGAQNVTVSGGTGAAHNLLFRNTLAASSPTIAFLNDASYNTLTNCTIESGNAATLTELNPGTVAFYGGAATGNRNNLINACDIGKRSDAPGTNPYVAVYSGGTPGSNSNNTLQNSNLADFSNSGIYLAPTGGGDNWTIGGSTANGGVTTGTGNNLYLTAAAASAITAINLAGGAAHTVSYNKLYQQSGTLAGYTGIYASAGNGLVIAYNCIGGSQPNAGGNPLTMGAGEFRGIHLLVGPGSPATPYALVHHNTVRNLTTGAGSLAYAYGIYHNSGAANISDNTIGDAAPPAPAVGFDASFSAYGIYLGSSTPSLVANNTVAGMSLGSATPLGNTLNGIYCFNNNSGGSHTVSGNAVSDLRVLSGAGPSETLYGIYVSTAAPVLVQNNVIKRLEVASGAGVNCLLGGINVLGIGAHRVLGNTIGGAAGEGLVNASNVSGASGSNTVLTAGIQAAGTGGLTVAGNTVSNVGNTSTFVPTSSLSVNAVFGIALLNASSGSSLVRSNRVQNLANAAPANPAAAPGALQEGVQGLALRGSTAGATLANNQVSLMGSAPAAGPVAGIVNAATGAANKVYFNSVYLSGITGAGIKTYALRHNSTSTAAGLLQLRNNVLINERTGGAGNFALGVSAAAAAVTVGTTSAAVVDADYNDLYASEAATKQAENGPVAYAFGAVTPATGWLGQPGSPDAHSQNVNTKFINTLTGNLALDATTNCSLNNAGLALAGVDGEYDNAATSRQTTPDLGADEFSPAQQTATLAPTGSACGSTASVTLTGNGGPFSITYTDGTTPVTAPAATSPFTFGTAPGKTYTLTSVLDSYGCSLATAGSLTVTDQTTYTGAAPNDGSNWFNPANWTACVPSSTLDALVPGGLSNYPDLNTAATAAVRSLALAPGARLTQRAGTLSISANLTNDATNVTLTGGTVAFVGGAAQTLGGTAPLSFFNLAVDKSSDTLHLVTNQVVAGALTLASGILKTYAPGNHHKVTLAGALAETPTSFVLGDVEVPAADLGFDGATSRYGGLGLTLTARTLRPDGSAAALPGPTTVVRSTGTTLYGTTPAGGPASRSIRRRYAITPVNDANLNVDLVFGYKDSGFELNGIAEPSLRLFSAPVLGGPFRPENGTLDVAANTVTATGLGHLSVWTLGDAAAPLPVELVRFEATHQGSDAALAWTTASERNNRGFEVQVSPDGRQFRPLGFVAGAGTSSAPRHYAYTDREARKTGWRYYRLRQTDADGTATFSPVRSLDFAGAAALLEASPVPFSTTLTLTLYAPKAQSATQFTLTDATGRPVLTQQFDVPAGTSQLPVAGVAALPAGLYLVQVVLDGQPLRIKVIKQ